jgi:hypothetical protein
MNQPPPHLSKEELIIWNATHAQGATTVAPVAPKAKFVMTPEHLAKLAAARAEYQRKLKAGEIQPPSRKPKTAEEPAAARPDAAPVAPVRSGPTTFFNSKTRWEFMVRNGNFDTDPIPCIYVTEVRGSIKPDVRGHYLIENIGGEWLTTAGKWTMKGTGEDVKHYWNMAPRFIEVQAALRLVGIELDMEFTI